MLAQHWIQAVYLLSYVSQLTLGAYLVFGQYISVGALIAASMLSGRTLGLAGQALMTLSRWTELQQSLKQLTPYLGDALGVTSGEVAEPEVISRSSEGIGGRGASSLRCANPASRHLARHSIALSAR
jgi:ABC-type bacteriocin/lantibiotic exporter with double-glycine peptidase domain